MLDITLRKDRLDGNLRGFWSKASHRVTKNTHSVAASLLGELSHKSLDQIGLGHVSKVELLSWEWLTHRLRLLDGNLSDGVGVYLRDGQGSSHLEVLGVEVLLLLHDGSGLNGWLNQLVADLLLDGSLGEFLNNLGGLVTAQEELTAGIRDGLLGLGRLDEGLKVIDLGYLLGLSLGLEGLLRCSELLDDFLALLADSNSGVRVLHQGGELFTLLEVSVVGLESHVEGNAHSESDHEANESGSALHVLVELIL